MPARTKVIADLRASIDGIERRAVLAERRDAEGVAMNGVPQIGAGTLCEIFSDGTRDAGAALGFALMQARGLITRDRPVALYLQMRAEGQETGLPYGPGLLRFGFDPDALCVVRTANITELLWAVEEAAGCGAVCAVIADVALPHKQLDFTASRRLSLRADQYGVALMIVRTGTAREASAAALRFHVAGLASAETAFDARAPGAARYRVTLEKGARRLSGADGRKDALGQDFWNLRWTENGLAADGTRPVGRRRIGTGGTQALSGAEPARLGDRLSQTA